MTLRLAGSLVTAGNGTFVEGCSLCFSVVSNPPFVVSFTVVVEASEVVLTVVVTVLELEVVLAFESKSPGTSGKGLRLVETLIGKIVVLVFKALPSSIGLLSISNSGSNSNEKLEKLMIGDQKALKVHVSENRFEIG